MSRIKSKKEYTLIIHSKLGDFFFHYYLGNYYFTQNLNKVKTWKSRKFSEKTILKILEKENSILLELGNNCESYEEYKDQLIYSRNKYFLPLKYVKYMNKINEISSRFELLNYSLIKDAESITETIRNFNHTEKSFRKIINNFRDDIWEYQEYNKIIQVRNNKNVPIIDIVDASFNFRFLKLTKLNQTQGMMNEYDSE